VLALALNGIGLVITGERWRGVVAALGSPLRLSRTTLINLAGIFVRNATPTTGLGGDASRIALLRAEGVPLARATASFAYVRLSIQQSATITIMGIAGGFVPTVGSVGAIDGSMVAGLMLFGATVEAAVAITIVGRVISYGVSTAAGAVALALLGGRGILRGV